MIFLLTLHPLSNMYDVFLPSYTPGCPHGCAAWNETSGPLWKTGKVPPQANSGGKGVCSMPAAQSGAHECDCAEKDADTYMTDSYAGPWCYCADVKVGEPDKAYCNPPNATVEQLNLQVAAPDTIVASFVTYEPLPAGPPVAMLSTSPLADGAAATQLQGVSHLYSFQPKPCHAPAPCPAP